MQASCSAIVGLTLVVVTNLAIIISFATPYWLQIRDVYSVYSQGLWSRCDNTGCSWFFENNFMQHEAQFDWFHAIQALMSLGLVAGLVALLVATLALCCPCRNCNSDNAVAAVLLIAFLVIGVSIVLFGVMAADDYAARVDSSPHIFKHARYSWSYWVGAAAAAMSLVTCIVYACLGRKYNVYV